MKKNFGKKLITGFLREWNGKENIRGKFAGMGLISNLIPGKIRERDGNFVPFPFPGLLYKCLYYNGYRNI